MVYLCCPEALSSVYLLCFYVSCTVLLERVFLRLGSADTDEQLEVALAKFLAPVLLKLASPADGVRKKVRQQTQHVAAQ